MTFSRVPGVISITDASDVHADLESSSECKEPSNLAAWWWCSSDVGGGAIGVGPGGVAFNSFSTKSGRIWLVPKAASLNLFQKDILTVATQELECTARGG